MKVNSNWFARTCILTNIEFKSSLDRSTWLISLMSMSLHDKFENRRDPRIFNIRACTLVS